VTAMHWEGGIRYARGTRLPGWPCCCSGDRAERIAADKQQTARAEDVTCRACLRLMAQDEREWLRAVAARPRAAGRDALAEQRARAESAELGCTIAYQREPTQAEGDAHEGGMPDHARGECFVPMGGWTGRRCRVCSRWTWGGPTACLECVRREEWDAASTERIAALEGLLGEAAEAVRYVLATGQSLAWTRDVMDRIEAALAAKGK